MDTSIATTLADILRRLPEHGPQRELGLQRLIDVYAADEAISALRTAATGAYDTSGMMADVLAAASALWDGRGFAAHGHAADGVAREQLRRIVPSEAFLKLLPGWIAELRQVAAAHPGTGACTIATAMELWSWTIRHFQQAGNRHEAAIAELAEVFCWLLAARCQAVAAAQHHAASGTLEFLADVCHVQTARSASVVGSTCAELVFGYRRHLSWDSEGCGSCYGADDLDELEGLMPGIASSARACSDVVESDGSHPAKAGPCAKFDGVEKFSRLRTRLDGCLTGARLARERAATALPRVLGTPLGV
jgi:hypothetical protein